MSMTRDDEAKQLANELFPRKTTTAPSGPSAGGAPTLPPGGAFSWVFDRSFDVLVTAKLVRLIYTLLLSALAVGSVVALLGSLRSGDLRGLVVVPLVFLLGAFLSRVFCEMLILGFRIAEHLAAIRVALTTSPPRG